MTPPPKETTSKPTVVTAAELQARKKGDRPSEMLATRELMEEFRGLLNLEVPERKLISFVFFGLPEIEKNLKLDAPLAQRVAMRYRLEPFTADSTEAYVKHRLRLAGCPKMPFSPEAIEAVHRRSGGTPRVINTLCDNALFEGFLGRIESLPGTLIDQIADNLGLETGLHRPGAAPPSSAPHPMAMPTSTVSVAVAAAPAAVAVPLSAAVVLIEPPPVNPPRPAASKPAKAGVDLAEIDRYLEGLGKL